MADREFILKIIGDVTGATKELDTLETKTETTRDKVIGAAKKVAAGVAVAAVVKFGKDSLSAAQDADEAGDKIQNVFGDTASVVEGFGKRASDSMGLSTSEYEKMAAQTGALLTSVGISTGDAAKQTDVLAQRAADVAAIFGGDANTAMDTFNKALTGQTKGLKDYGVILDKTDIDARAMAEGYVDASGKVTDAGRAIAAQELILEKTSKQAGEFKKNSGDLGSQQQILQAKFKNLQETIGTALLPVIEKLVSLIQPFMTFMASNMSWILPMAAAIGGIVVAMKAWGIATQVAEAAQVAWGIATKVATAAQWLFNAAMTANPIGLIIAAIAAVIAIVVLLYVKVQWFRDFVDAAIGGIVTAWNWFLDAIKVVWNWIADNWPLLLAIITGPIGIAVKLIVDNWETIKNTFKAAFDFIAEWVGKIPDLFRAIVGFITTIVNGYIEIITWPFRKAYDGIKIAIDKVPDVFRSAVTTITNALSTVWDVVSYPFKEGARLAKSAFQEVLDFFGGIGTKINNMFSGVADIIKYPFTQAFNAIKTLWNNTVGGFGFTVPSWVPGVGGKGFKIPRMALGGIVTRPTIAMIGEAGPEAVVPLGRGGGFGNVTLNVYALASSAEVGRQVFEALREYERISGRAIA